MIEMITQDDQHDYQWIAKHSRRAPLSADAIWERLEWLHYWGVTSRNEGSADLLGRLHA